MARSTGAMSPRGCVLVMGVSAVLTLLGSACGGPVGPLPNLNVTSSDLGVTTEAASCTRGSSVYKSGERFTGMDPCERCSCSGGDVTCTREVCAPRPGCKAVHRPDHCCPTYQCECEQEGRVYGNGEKLVDPQDPCRVCYCQGGEVVCRRIACFVRDDCRPRLVPGRCCPEYDNCPLRGVTAIPGMFASGSPPIEDVGTTPTPIVTLEKVKQEITIKEITPVSEIPVITDVKIKEIIPSPSVEVIEYPSSSKAPLIPREATSENSVRKEAEGQTFTPVVSDNYPSSSSMFTSTASSTQPPATNIKVTEGVTEMRPVEDLYPSKISLSTQDAINSDIYPSNIPNVATSASTSSPITTKAPIVEEEEQTVFEHNPAFPPLPDDLSVSRNHEDENSPDPSVSMDTDHNEHVISSAIPPTEIPTSKDVLTTVTTTTTTTTPAPTTVPSTTVAATTVPSTTVAATTVPPTTVAATTVPPATKAPTTRLEVPSTRVEITTTQKTQASQVNPMLNLRSAIPTEILNVPSSVSEVITGELDELEETTTEARELIPVAPIITTKLPVIIKEVPKQITTSMIEQTTVLSSKKAVPVDTTMFKVIEVSTPKTQDELTTTSIPKSNVATEVTSQTELSSLPIETSDQHPPAHSANDEKAKITSTEESLTIGPTSIKIIPTEAEPITVSRDMDTVKEYSDSVETTEFVITTFGSSESTSSPVELIKISNEPAAKSAAIIKSPTKNKNSVLTDLIKLVDDVASIGNHTEAPVSTKQTQPATAGIPDSEELIPVNAGYKSKINNFNLNSITEVPLKSKNPPPSKLKGVEIEDDEAESITDLPAPSKAEPTTRRPIIDNVNDDTTQKGLAAEKDIEIITKSYVPSIVRRPTKVVMKSEQTQVAALAESATEDATTVREAGTPVPSVPSGPPATPAGSTPPH